MEILPKSFQDVKFIGNIVIILIATGPKNIRKQKKKKKKKKKKKELHLLFGHQTIFKILYPNVFSGTAR